MSRLAERPVVAQCPISPIPHDDVIRLRVEVNAIRRKLKKRRDIWLVARPGVPA
jgi:hypothetical protein